MRTLIGSLTAGPRYAGPRRSSRVLALLGAASAIGCAAPRPAATPADTATLEIDGGTLYYVARGPAGGVPLVVLHGGPGLDHGSVAPTPVWDALASNRRVVLYDQRASGKSQSRLPASSLTVARLVDDLEALRQHLNAPKLDLVGWSWGGFLSMAYAVRFPDRVAHLVLVGPAPPRLADDVYLFDDVYPDVIARHAPDTTPAAKLGCLNATIGDYLKMEFYDPARRDAFLAGGPVFFSEAACVHFMTAALPLDITPQVRTLEVPTLVIAGRFDVNVAPVFSYRLSKTIPNARFAIIEESGHMPFIEQPERFRQLVEDFIGR
jgi:proline iminopeptidase